MESGYEGVIPPERELTGQEYHVMSEKEREGGDFQAAVEDAARASAIYLTEGNPIKAAEAKSSEFLAHRHLFETTGQEQHRDNARKAIEESVKIIRDSGEKIGLGTPLYNLAKFYQTTGEFDLSIGAMKDALNAFRNAPEDPMGFSGHIAEISTRLAAFEYRQRDDSAQSRFDEALEELRKNPHPDAYSQLVWFSGAHMHMAEAYFARREKDKALEQLGLAEQIVKGDERLKVRQDQLAELKKRLV